MNYGMNLGVLLEGFLDDVPDIALSSITQVPERVRAGSAFVAPNADDLPDAQVLRRLKNDGCVVVLHDADCTLPELNLPKVAVPGLGRRAGELASRFWAAPSDLMTIAAVAGTSRRPAVAHYLAQVWQRFCGGAGLFSSCGFGPMDALQPSDPSVVNVFSLNETLAACLDSGIEHAAVEISPAALSQGRCQILQIDLAVITGGHAGMAQQPERQLFTEFAPTFTVINVDDPVSRAWATEFAGVTEMLSYGLVQDAELSGRIVTMDDQGMALHLSGPWGEADVLTDLHGEGEALNLLAAAAALVLLGMDWRDACRELEYLRPAPSDHAGQERGRQSLMERAA